MKTKALHLLLAFCTSSLGVAADRGEPRDERTTPLPVLHVSGSEYLDRVQAVWTAQVSGVLLAWPHEHQVASTLQLDQFPRKYTFAPVDDDWYYEMVAVRAFEKHGIRMTVA